jgi:hypothetical protein
MRWTAVPIVLKPQLKVDGDRPARTRQYVRRTVRRSVCAVINDESDDVPGNFGVYLPSARGEQAAYAAGYLPPPGEDL